MTRAHRLLAVPLTCAAVLLPAAPAPAEEPERTGWWNRLAAGGTAVPAPTTAEGDLRVSQAPDGPAAYAAVLYPSFEATAATLTLQVRADRTAGTPDVLACVTADAQWPEGGNQPFDKAPEYDCDAGSAFGQLAPDGSTLTFQLDSGQQDPTGSWSLALVPAPGSAPFTVDLAEPEADAFVSDSSSGSGEALVSEPFESDVDSGSGEPAPALESGDLGLAGAEVPAAEPGTAEMPPLVAGDDAPAQAAGPEPAVADTAPAGPPLLQARPTGAVQELDAGRRLLALLVLAAGCAAVGYAAGQQRPGPRLIGGRARVVGAPAAVPALAGVEDRPRGIGRFARPRDAAPRRLR